MPTNVYIVFKYLAGNTLHIPRERGEFKGEKEKK